MGLREWWGGPPGPRGTPSSPRRNDGIGILQSASRPTGASAADRGVRPTTHHAGGFSTLLGWAFRPRNFMKNWHHCNGGSGKVVGTVEQSRPRLCLIWSMLRFCANNWASFVSLGSGDSHVPLPGNTFWHALRFAEGEARCLIESQQWTFTRRCWRSWWPTSPGKASFSLSAANSALLAVNCTCWPNGWTSKGSKKSSWNRPHSIGSRYGECWSSSGSWRSEEHT